MRYYSVLRPIGIGTCPGDFDIFENFAEREFIESIGREAWGWIEYDRELTDEEMYQFDLVKEGSVLITVALFDADSGALRIVKTRNDIEAFDALLGIPCGATIGFSVNKHFFSAWANAEWDKTEGESWSIKSEDSGIRGSFLVFADELAEDGEFQSITPAEFKILRSALVKGDEAYIKADDYSIVD